MRLSPLLLAASLIAPLTLALPHADAPEPRVDVDAILALAGDERYPAQGPVRALALAHGVTLDPVEVGEERALTVSLLDAYASLGYALTPELVQDVELAAQELPLELHEYVAPLVDALTEANQVGVRLHLGKDVTDEDLLTAALHVAAASEHIIAANTHEPLPWPENGWTAPLDVIRLGGTNADTYAAYHYLSIDPHGDDTYTNNAGATRETNVVLRRAALALDLQGDDMYTYCDDVGCYEGPRAGSAVTGIGLLIDADGNDTYDTRGHQYTVAAAASFGLAAVLDLSNGDDWVNGGGWGASYAAGTALALYYDEGGDDDYDTGSRAISYPAGGTSLFIDNHGADDYTDSPDAGFSENGCGGIGLFIDNGGGQDAYPVRIGIGNNRLWHPIYICHTTMEPHAGLGTDQ